MTTDRRRSSTHRKVVWSSTFVFPWTDRQASTIILARILHILEVNILKNRFIFILTNTIFILWVKIIFTKMNIATRLVWYLPTNATIVTTIVAFFYTESYVRRIFLESKFWSSGRQKLQTYKFAIYVVSHSSCRQSNWEAIVNI